MNSNMFITDEYGLKKDTERRRSEQLKEGQRERGREENKNKAASVRSAS